VQSGAVNSHAHFLYVISELFKSLRRTCLCLIVHVRYTSVISVVVFQFQLQLYMTQMKTVIKLIVHFQKCCAETISLLCSEMATDIKNTFDVGL